MLNKEWNDDNKLPGKINDCINIENYIKNIIEINDNIEKNNSKTINIKFVPENEQNIELVKNIIKFGETLKNDDLNFKFKPGNNYNVSNNGLIASKNNGGNAWNCAIIGDREIPKEAISKWKIKIKKDKTKDLNFTDICIGVGPSLFKNNSNLIFECWSIYGNSGNSKVMLQLQNNNQDYNKKNISLK